MNIKPQCLLAGLVLVAASLGLLGCQSLSKPDSASFASVRIQGRSPEQIRDATVATFKQDGYQAVHTTPDNLVFEKEGSRWDRMAYGSWVDDEPVCIRVKASIVALSDDVFRLQCTAYLVRSKGDKVFEEEVRLRNSHSKPYQALLDKVLGRLRK